MTSLIDPTPGDGTLGASLSAALETVFTEGTVIFCFIVVVIAFCALILRIIGMLIELRRAQIRVLARQRDEERMLAEAAKMREENQLRAAAYKNPLEGRVFLPGQVSFEEVMSYNPAAASTSSVPASSAGAGVGMSSATSGLSRGGISAFTQGGAARITDGTVVSNPISSLSHRHHHHHHRGERKSFVTARVPQSGTNAMLPRIDSLVVNEPGMRISTSSTLTTDTSLSKS